MTDAVRPVPPPLRRDTARGWVGGVCAGLAGRVGVDPLVLRLLFVAMTVAGGAGLILYAVLWGLVPAPEGAAATAAPARRLALPGGPRSLQVAAGIGALTLALLLLLRHWGLWLGDAFLWPAVLVAGGAALTWRQTTDRRPARAPTERLAPDVLGRGAVGAALVVAGGLVFLWLNNALAPARDVLLAAVVILVSAALVLAPWWVRLVRGLTAERAERIRSQERAEMAAHLHDSVLQTLALVQRRADDPRAVATLARRQERELRAWLSGDPAPTASLAAELARVAAEVEDAHGVVVEAVTVGDRPLDEHTSAVAAAAREALTNAAKFAGDAPIDLYAEMSPERVEVFVRDRGPGFDPAAVPGDRRGVRESILGRMARHGGRADIHPGPGAGMEVELVL